MESEIIYKTLEKSFHHSSFTGKLAAPFSKSYTQRAIALGLLAKGETQILNPAICDDTYAALNLAKGLGANVKIANDRIHMKSDFKAEAMELSAGESGLAVRMFSPIVALLKDQIKISGSGTLLKRPVSMMENPLKSLGVKFESNNGFLPIHIQGPIKGGFATINGSLGSQFLTGLLMALPLAENDSDLIVTNLQSIPYIDMTLDIMQHFGVEIENTKYKNFNILGNQYYEANSYTVEGDWSNAAFYLVGGAIAGKIELTGLNPKSKQADVAILKALKAAGANVYISKNYVIAEKSDLKAFEFDATHCPDLFPPLVILAASCKGNSIIKGTNRLTYKESNRAAVLQSELGKIGIRIELNGDLMIIYGGEITGGVLHSNNDHRIAMAGAIASLVSKKTTTIQNAQAVNKSYPRFYEDFESLKHHGN